MNFDFFLSKTAFSMDYKNILVFSIYVPAFTRAHDVHTPTNAVHRRLGKFYSSVLRFRDHMLKLKSLRTDALKKVLL